MASIIRAPVPDYRIRPATLDDLDLDALVHHRVAMFTDMGVAMEAPALRAAFRAWLLGAMPAGDYRAWVAETATGDIAAGAGMSLLRWPPGPNPAAGDRLAFIYNVYTEPAHRNRGLATSLMETIHSWCTEHGVHALALNASTDARHLYESMGYFDAPARMMYKRL
jgi:GNAT superfamily N-acetyltransferase